MTTTRSTRHRGPSVPIRLAAVAVLAAAAAHGPAPAAHADPQPRPARAVARFVLPVEAGAVARPFVPPAHRYASGHRGVDLRAGPGQSVLSPGDGTVSFVGQVAGRDVLSVDHGGGWRSAIEPVIAYVGEGDLVRRGQPVGTVGTGGHCDGSCVHWGVRFDGDYVDPMTLVEVWVILLPLDGPPAARVGRGPNGVRPGLRRPPTRGGARRPTGDARRPGSGRGAADGRDSGRRRILG